MPNAWANMSLTTSAVMFMDSDGGSGMYEQDKHDERFFRVDVEWKAQQEQMRTYLDYRKAHPGEFGSGP